MNNSQIGIFIALAKYKNFTQAAKNLYVSQPLISKQLAALEEEIGVTLFNRNHHTVVITPAGEFMLEYYTKWKKEYDAAIQKAINIQENLASLNIGLMEFTDIQPMAKAIRHFSTTYPSCQFQINTCFYSESHRSVETDRNDLVIGLASAFDSISNISYRELPKGHNYLILSENHPKYNLPELSLLDFISDCFILPEGNDSNSLRKLCFSVFNKYGFTPTSIISANGIDAMLQMVLSGIAVAIVNFGPGYMNCYDSIRFIDVDFDSDYWIVWKNSIDNPTVPIFCDLLEQYIDSE